MDGIGVDAFGAPLFYRTIEDGGDVRDIPAEAVLHVFEPKSVTADSSKIGCAGVRLVVAKAARRFSFRQLILIHRLIRPVWAYIIGDSIGRGDLPPMPGWWKITATRPKSVCVDTGREAQQNRADVELGIRTIQDHYAELGLDWEEQLQNRALNARRILDLAAQYNVPVSMLWGAPGQNDSVAQPTNAKVEEVSAGTI